MLRHMQRSGRQKQYRHSRVEGGSSPGVQTEARQGRGRQGAMACLMATRLQLLGHALAGSAVEVLGLLSDRAGQPVGGGAGLAGPLRRVVAVGG